MDKIFLVRRSELEGRLDPFCYIPNLVFLDNLIKSKTDNRLKDFAVGYSSGATPSKDESDIHYTSKEKGFPFVRVQNLSTTGELNFDNMKYISKATHNGLLNRSKVFAGDLLVKITGVGRMAVASVAPECFEGNINQHIVVIRTGSVVISQNLAAFINLDCIEKLASKRATGGTRPALDYPALFSLPVISDKRVSVKMAVAAAVSKQKEAKAQQLLDSIDTYLMNELGIEQPTVVESSISKRMFVRKFSEVTGGRFDAYYFKEVFEQALQNIANGSYPFRPLRDIATDVKNGVEIRDYVENGYRYLRVTDLGKHEINLNSPRYVKADQIPEKIKLKEESILISRSGSLGLINVAEDSIIDAILSSHIFKVDLNTKQILPNYAVDFLRCKIGQIQLFRQNNGGVIPEINQAALGTILIPIPPLEKQNEIAAHIQTIRNKAKQLRAEAAAGLEQAKREVEAMIIGRY